ncbi:MAG: endonuclease [Frankiales bacterium]|nr:endonuclease [Frankiales bacterium]
MSSTSRQDQQRALLSELAEVEALDAQLFARRMRLRAAMDDLWNPPELPSPQEQFGVLELAGTARIGQTRASSQLVDGVRLVEELPGSLQALLDGRMYRETAVLLLERTRNCSPAVTREVERRLLPVVTDANTTDVRRLLTQVIPEVEADLEPALTKQRLEQARSRRSVWQDDRGNGMVGTHAEIDAISARRWSLDFEELVRAQKIADDRAGIVRTADQRRADVFAQLPSRQLALLIAIQQGKTDQLLALSAADPGLAEDLEALAGSVPMLTETIPMPPAPTETPEPTEPAERQELRELSAAPSPDEHGTLGWEVQGQDEPPLPHAPPPESTYDPDPATAPPTWTDLGWLELASTLLGLPVSNPLVLYVHTPMTTLLEVDHRTGSIDGGGALPAEHVRMLLPTADLRRVFVDPGSGVPIGVDPQLHRAARSARSGFTTGVGRERLEPLLSSFVLRDRAEPRHDPSRRLRAFIELRDQRCTGIGCSQPAGRCHLDHELAYPAGPTATWNLAAKSSRCHRAKHAGWTVTRHGPGPQHGQTTWTSPLGHSYTRLSSWSHPGRAARAVAIRDRFVIELDLRSA